MKLVILMIVFFGLDAGWDSFLTRGGISLEYLVESVWFRISVLELVVYGLCVSGVALIALCVSDRLVAEEKAILLWSIRIVVGVCILLPLRYAWHVFSTLT